MKIKNFVYLKYIKWECSIKEPTLDLTKARPFVTW